MTVRPPVLTKAEAARIVAEEFGLDPRDFAHVPEQWLLLRATEIALTSVHRALLRQRVSRITRHLRRQLRGVSK